MENATYSNLWYDDIRASYSGATLCGWVRPVLYIGLEQRRPTNPIGGDSKKSQGIGCWSTVNSLQSPVWTLKIIKFFSHENYRWEQFIAALELISDWDLTSSMNWIFLLWLWTLGKFLILGMGAVGALNINIKIQNSFTDCWPYSNVWWLFS